MPLEIRAATPEDAPAACQVMRRSIAELCVADHQNDEAILTRWLGNKTPEIFVSWIRQPDNSLLVAAEGGNILAVGSVTDAGQITLNYVSPDARFRGVSRALLGALEARAVERGNTRCTLTSTETARRFYLANGYVEDGLIGRIIACLRRSKASLPINGCKQTLAIDRSTFRMQRMLDGPITCSNLDRRHRFWTS